MIYRQTRNSYQNLEKRMYPGVGPYGIPEIKPVHFDGDELSFIGFNYAKGCKDPEGRAVHFFVDDYQFDRVWTRPDNYVDMLSRFAYVCSPDFSPYADFPKAIQLYNHYRKHWLGAFWQELGIPVIPTVTWSDPSTLEWCFDGEPVGGCVALSSVGMFKRPEYTEWLNVGYRAMLERLRPDTIFWKGRIPDEVDRDAVRIIEIPTFTEKWKADKSNTTTRE